MLPPAHCFILLVTVSGKRYGNKNINNNKLTMVIALILSVLNNIFLIGIGIRIIAGEGGMKIMIKAKCSR
jgi:hypothetical protein